MKKLNHVLAIGLLAFSSPALASAASITEDSLSALSSPSVNLSSGTAAFAYYGDTSNKVPLFTAGINPNPTTDAGNLGQFTAFTVSGAVAQESDDNLINISYTQGVGGANPATETGATHFDFAGGSSGPTGSFSLTSTLFAPTETFHFYLQDFATTSDLTLSLNDAAHTSFSLNNQVLFGGTDATGSGNSTAILTFTVTGDIGDILTFTDKSDTHGVAHPQFANVGLDGVTITGVPEPATYAMMALGALVLIWRLRRGKLTV